jgi:DNA-binding NarL/FixJ family response regulator
MGVSRLLEDAPHPAIAERLVISPGVVEKHVASIFAKLGLLPSDNDNRRVIAAMKFLQS